MGPTSKIAALLKITQKEAAALCEQVRTLSGLGTKLPYKTIAQLISEDPTRSPSLEKIVEIIGTEAPRRLPAKKAGKLAGKAKWKAQMADIINRRAVTRKYLKQPVFHGNVIPTSALDHERVDPERMGHCPHGVSRSNVCAICNPQKFRELTGID